MPIVDGMTSTKMIREYEAKAGLASLSDKARQNSRVPIFAVSASLEEAQRQTYIDTGFDAWVMKPINFNRLDLLLKGITDRESRKEAMYQPGQWENGGWLV